MSLWGIHPIVPTPFDQEGGLDPDSMKRLSELLVKIGVQGVAILGVMGEAHKLTQDEQEEVIATFRAALPPSVELVVGVRAAGTDPAIQAAKHAARLGATALLVGPPTIQSDDAIFTYYKRVAEATELPVIVHDYPASTGILMSPALLARMYKEIENVQYVKLEDPPTGIKMARLRQLVGDDGFGVFGALGGAYAFEELDRGAVGIMTGFAYPELLLDIYNSYKAGDVDRAANVFYDVLPLIRFEFQPAIGVSLRKHILCRRGVFRSTKVRHPGTEADAKTLEHLDRLLAHLRARGYEV